MADYIDTTLIDGYAGGPHITEKQIGLVNQGTYGPSDYVLEEGNQAAAEVLTNNSVRIKDGVFVIQGRRDAMAANDYEDISIDNGAQGVNRNDIIVRRYQKNESSEIEQTSFAVIKGTAVSGTAADPEVPTGDIRTGALLHNMKLYRVRIEGLNIVAVEPLFQILMNAETVQEKIAELNSNLSQKGIWEQIGVKTNKERIYFDPDKYSSLFLEVRVHDQYASIYLPAPYIAQIDNKIEKSFVVGGYQNTTYPGVWIEIKCGKMGTAAQPYVYFNRGFVNGAALSGDYGLALWGMLR